MMSSCFWHLTNSNHSGVSSSLPVSWQFLTWTSRTRTKPMSGPNGSRQKHENVLRLWNGQIVGESFSILSPKAHLNLGFASGFSFQVPSLTWHALQIFTCIFLTILCTAWPSPYSHTSQCCFACKTSNLACFKFATSRKRFFGRPHEKNKPYLFRGKSFCFVDFLWFFQII